MTSVRVTDVSGSIAGWVCFRCSSWVPVGGTHSCNVTTNSVAWPLPKTSESPHVHDFAEAQRERGYIFCRTCGEVRRIIVEED